MIVWLSSFPRSGNTLLRLMLKRVWDIETCSMYDDRDDIGGNPAIAERIGHRFLDGRFEQAYQSMRDSAELFCVKTHDIPIDQGKSIYIVRDGRCASNSYWHYQHDFGQIQNDATLAEILIGFTPYGSWSDHLDAWEPLERPNTLVLRYETLTGEPEEQIRRIADFLELQPHRPWQNEFDALRRLEPRFFREGSNALLPSFGEAEESLFWLMHGSWMTRLGYAPAQQSNACASQEVRRLFYQCVARQQGRFNLSTAALSQRRGERKLLEQRLQDLQHQLAEAGDQIQEANRRLDFAEKRPETLSRSPLLRAFHILRSSSLSRILAPSRPIRASIAAMLALLAAAIHTE